MRVAAIIPARGGSTRVPGKNLRPLNGRSLVERAVTTALEALGGDVYVTTDNDAIGAEAMRAGAAVIWRPAELAGDMATAWGALQHALTEVDAEAWLLLNATNPFRSAATVRAGRSSLRSGRDPVSAALSHAHAFTRASGAWWGILDGRPRTQECASMAEAGGMWGGHVGGGERLVESVGVSGFEALDIDTETDWIIAEAVAEKMEGRQ